VPDCHVALQHSVASRPEQMHHSSRVIASPWPGVFSTDVDSARHYDRHWHATFGIGFMERGAHRSLSGRGSVDAHAGEVITNNPGEVHDGRPLGAPARRWRMVCMEPMVLASISDRIDGPAADVRLTRPVIRDEKLASVLRRLLQRLDRWSAALRPSSESVLACEESLVLACGLALRDHSTRSPGREARGEVRRARERLADDIGNPPSLSELAALARISKYQLLRRFEQTYGMTPHEWLRQLRVERARASIRGGTPLAHVAAECGFADQSHMTRAFVAHFGFTPGSWQRAVARRADRP
jgi:AraC-like DNA-binding protein